VLEAARLHPDHLAVMGRFALELPESRNKVATWKQQPGMLGVRLIFVLPHQRAWLSDGTADWFWPAAEREGIGVMIYVPGNLPPVKEIAERYPGLSLSSSIWVARGAAKTKRHSPTSANSVNLPVS